MTEPVGLTFDDARLVALARRRPTWGTYGEAGEPAASLTGRADARTFAVFINSREWLEDNDPDMLVLDEPVYFVDRRTGAVAIAAVHEAFDRLDAMDVVELPPDTPR